MAGIDRKVLLVTGAAGDIGAAIAEAFVDCGAAVLLSDVRAGALEDRALALAKRGPVACLPADLRDPAGVVAMARTALAWHGRIDYLVNNAAIQHDGDVLDCEPDAFDDAYAVNVRAPYLLCREIAPAMRRQGGGSIVNIASVHATAPGPRRLAYATTKTALLGLTRSLAVDLGRHQIRVNALSPGATSTSQLRDAWSRRQAEGAGDLFSHASRQHPLGRLAAPADIAGAAVYLSQASFVTGVELRVDGGFLAALRLMPG